MHFSRESHLSLTFTSLPHCYRPSTQHHSSRLPSLSALLLTLLLSLHPTAAITMTSTNSSYYHSLFLSLGNNHTAYHHLLVLTRRPHIASSLANEEAADYVASSLSSSSFHIHSVNYSVLLPYPSHRNLSLIPRPDNPQQPPISFDLVQEVYPGDPYADAAREVTPTFHAFAKSGNVVGPIVYAYYGRVEDFARLRAMGVNTTGSVVLARYKKIFRGDIIKNAEEAGAVGVVVYTDRKDYGDGKVFPDGWWMPPSGVQPGSVFRGIGDPTTPGWASVPACERQPREEMVAAGLLPGVPSLPLSYKDAEEIQRWVGGAKADKEWQGGDGSFIYHVGPGPAYINLAYKAKEEFASIRNVFGVIQGYQEPDRYVLLGNHRDAWSFGAVDPNSGTAAMLEIAERLDTLQKRGWRPRRTIILCSWDAEEYGVIGSTEWVEDKKEMLASKAVAYLNVDVAVSASGFSISGSPQLDDLIIQAMQNVQDPDNSNRTVYDSWITSGAPPLIRRLGGSGSDYAAFVQHVGVPSTDMYFGGLYPVYHSLYDDFIWMKKFGDPMFQRHVAVASIWGYIALRLADDELLPFNYRSYASELQKDADQLKKSLFGVSVSLDPLYDSIEDLRKAAEKVNKEKKTLERYREKSSMMIRELNDRLMSAERAFVDPEGLVPQQLFKHLIYGRAPSNGYGSLTFPRIYASIDTAKSLNSTKSWQKVHQEVWRVARAIRQASSVLNGELLRAEP